MLGLLLAQERDGIRPSADGKAENGKVESHGLAAVDGKFDGHTGESASVAGVGKEVDEGQSGGHTVESRRASEMSIKVAVEG